MSKRVLRNFRVSSMSMIISTCLVLGGGFSITASAATVPESCFTFDSGIGQITNYDASCGNDVDIPSSIGGVDVTSIGLGAFKNKSLVAVSIPSLIQNISNEAFMDNQLSSVTFSEGLQIIGDWAFANNRLSSLSLPSTLTTIGDSGGCSFAANLLTDVALPSGVTFLQGSAFSYQGADSIDSVDNSNIWYARVYTADPANPAGVMNGQIAEFEGYDMNGDGDYDDSFGGHIINPARIAVSYVDTNGATLRPSTTLVGQGSLADYMATSNAANDLDRYYLLGQTITVNAPLIDGMKPDAATKSVALSQPSNTLTFVYSPVGQNETPPSGTEVTPGAPNTSVGTDDAGGELPAFVLLLAVLTAVAALLRHHRLSHRSR